MPHFKWGLYENSQFYGPHHSIGCRLLLGGCGSDGGGGVASTPAPTYSTLQQMVAQGGNRKFSTSGIQADVSNAVPAYANNTYGSGVTVAYTASSDSYTLTAPNGTVQAFLPSDITSTPGSSAVAYVKSAGANFDLFAIAPASVNGVTLSYTLFGTWLHATGSATTIWLTAGGVPTQANDMPRNGTASYSTTVTGNAQMLANPAAGYTLDANSTATFSANFSAGTVATSLNLVGVPTSGGGATSSFGTFNGTGTIASSGPGFSGTFTGPVAGTFSGNFNGPQAAEMAYGWGLNTSGLSAFGQVAGKKN